MASATRRRQLGQCVKCQRRQARFANGTCIACDALISAENIKLENGRKHIKEVSYEKMQSLADDYNRLVNGGCNQRQAAEKLGWDHRRLNGYLSKARKRGIVVVNLSNKCAPQEPLPVRSRAQGGRANEHGGGKWGVAKCHCEPCLQRRRDTRALIKKEKAQGLR